MTTVSTPTLTRSVSRWLARIEPDADGHWLWPGSRTWDGYGRLRLRPRKGEPGKAHELVAHRGAWLVLVGAIPERHVLRSTCGVRHCIRPEHHRPVPFDWSPYDDVISEVRAACDAPSTEGKAA